MNENANKIKILIVEDEAIISMILKNYINKLGYETCSIVATGEDAILHSKEDNPDMIFMDIRLAGKMDGIQAAKSILSNKNISIAFMTSYTNPDTVKKAKELNPIAFLSKPVEIYDVEDVINLYKQRS